MQRSKKTERDPTLAVIYCRVSTEEQATKGLSLDAQERELEAYASAQGLRILERYVDPGHSATTDSRPDFQRMMVEVLSPGSSVGRVLVIHGSRFMRDTHLAAVYRAKMKRGGVVLIATQQPEGEGPIGELMSHLMDGVAQFESQTIGVRARAGMAESARNGFYPHAIAPFGYYVSKVNFRGRQRNRLVPSPEEAEVIVNIFGLYQGGRGGQAIAQHLNSAGVTRRGSRWNRDNVLKTLGDSTVMGAATWGKQNTRTGALRPESDWITIAVEPIVTKDTFERVQQLRAERDPVKTPGRASSSPLLLGGGVARCGHCGSSLGLQTSGKKRPDGSDYQFYCCAKAKREGRTACPDGRPIPVHQLDHEVMSQVAQRAFSEARARRILERLCAGPLRASRERDIAKVRRVIQGLEVKRERLVDAVARGALSPEDVREKLETIRAEADTKESELALLRAALPPKMISRKLVKRFMRRATKAVLEDEDVRRGYRVAGLGGAVVVAEDQTNIAEMYSGYRVRSGR